MESTGEPLRIHCSETTRLLLDTIGGYITTDRGVVNVKVTCNIVIDDDLLKCDVTKG